MTIPSSDSLQSESLQSDSTRRSSSEADLAGSQESGDRASGALASPGEASARPRRLALHFVAVLAGASVLAGWVWGARAGLSAALGVGLAGANLLLMQKITRAMTEGAAGGGNAAWGLALPFKLVALVGVAYVLVSRGVAQPVPLAMGFALLPLTGVFLPRPTSVRGPQVHEGPARLDPHQPRSRRDPVSRRRQPAA